MAKFLLYSAAIAMIFSVTGCGQTAKFLGFEKKAPDEFLVVSRAPLSIPPDFGLRPPDPDAVRSDGKEPGKQAAADLFGATSAGAAVKAASTSGELVLLTNTGAFDANPEIRLLVDQESAVMAVEEDDFVDELLFWKEKDQAGTIIDANAEQQRLQENAGLGKPVTEGDTPMIRRESEGTASQLLDFDWPF